MLPEKLDPTSHWRGDLWRDGYRHFGPMADEDGNPPAPPCLYCRIQFREKDKLAMKYELNSNPGPGQGTITIVDGVHYEFDIPDQALPLDAGTYLWDFETFLTADHTDPPLTWLTGSIVIKQDISHD